ncbi:MAG: gliding motility-associated C-terminal domain-containing protein [Flavobacteriales bacterium]|nr:gliding motility-associated C-terminal domain-containing protein [Flavobacteriales bacterium]
MIALLAFSCEKQQSVWLYVPSIFTPNDDGSNDVLMYEISNSNQVTFVKMVIHDSFYDEVFITNQENEYWDGKNLQGSACQNGAYYWTIHYTLKDLSLEEKGVVELFK